MTRTLHFGWFLGAGFGVQGWGEPGYGVGYDWKRPEIYQQAAGHFERNGLELFVIEDGVTVPDTFEASARVTLASAQFAPKHDPLPFVPLLLSATERIGIVPTISASFYEPFTAARLVATLSHFAPGRVGINLVTSGSDLAAQNYGLDKQVEHDRRYDRADEWVDVVRALWSSWETDAVREDRDAGVFADHRKVHPIDHIGEFFRVRGPLNAVPPIEQPLFVQAGSSPRGRAFAGRNADVVLAFAAEADRSRVFRENVRRAAVEAGRSADAVKVLFVVAPTITANARETQSVLDARRELTRAVIERQLQGISYLTGIDFARFDLDEPLPALTTNSNRGTLDDFLSSAGEGATLREILAARHQGGRRALVGTAGEVADRLEEFAEQTSADGYLLTGHVHPASVHRVLDPLVPELRRRGLIRSELGTKGARANLFEF